MVVKTGSFGKSIEYGTAFGLFTEIKPHTAAVLVPGRPLPLSGSFPPLPRLIKRKSSAACHGFPEFTVFARRALITRSVRYVSFSPGFSASIPTMPPHASKGDLGAVTTIVNLNAGSLFSSSAIGK
jgi:hypothetical protein